jgi:hypothetical protein
VKRNLELDEDDSVGWNAGQGRFNLGEAKGVVGTRSHDDLVVARVIHADQRDA